MVKYMRKILIIIIVLLSSGCGKKLTCTYKESYEDIKINNRIVFNLKNNTYSQVDTMVFKTSEEAEDYFKDIEEYISEYNLTLKNNKIISNLDGNIEGKTKKELKNQYESYEYTCK